MKIKYEDKPANWNMMFCLEEMVNLLEVNNTWYVDNLNEFVTAMFDAEPKVKDGFYIDAHSVRPYGEYHEIINRLLNLVVEQT